VTIIFVGAGESISLHPIYYQFESCF